MHPSVYEFFDTHCRREDFCARRVLEVGSYDVNGTLRERVMKFEPSEYVGIDMRDGPLVDYVIEATHIERVFGRQRFDAVICTEMLEHAEHWQIAVQCMKNVLSPGGLIVLTTRSKGFPLHEFPGDFWRFSKYDLHAAFCDFDIMVLMDDNGPPGVFLKAVRPVSGYEPIDISKMTVYRVTEADAA